MADLAERPAGATNDGAVDDRAHADAAADGDDQQVVEPATGTVEVLSHGQGVDVVVDEDGNAQASLEDAGETRADPLGQWRADDVSRARLDAAGHADADTQWLLASEAGFLAKLVEGSAEELDDLVERGVCGRGAARPSPAVRHRGR